MTSYYFPFGAGESVSKNSVDLALTAITSSMPRTPFTAKAFTASFASSVVTTPPAGTDGVSITLAQCQALETASGFINLIKGEKGDTGDEGGSGAPYVNSADNTPCPTGTIECPLLFESLSMALPGYPSGINASLPSGSRYVRVCMQVPPQCTTPVCPPYLYTASLPAIS